MTSPDIAKGWNRSVPAVRLPAIEHNDLREWCAGRIRTRDGRRERSAVFRYGVGSLTERAPVLLTFPFKNVCADPRRPRHDARRLRGHCVLLAIRFVHCVTGFVLAGHVDASVGQRNLIAGNFEG